MVQDVGCLGSGGLWVRRIGLLLVVINRYVSNFIQVS